MIVFRIITEPLKRSTICENCKTSLQKGQKTIKFEIEYKGIKLGPRFCNLCGTNRLFLMKEDITATLKQFIKKGA